MLASIKLKRPSAFGPRLHYRDADGNGFRKAGHSVFSQQSRAKVFALDMSMGRPDADNQDFRESA